MAGESRKMRLAEAIALAEAKTRSEIETAPDERSRQIWRLELALNRPFHEWLEDALQAVDAIDLVDAVTRVAVLLVDQAIDSLTADDADDLIRLRRSVGEEFARLLDNADEFTELTATVRNLDS